MVKNKRNIDAFQKAMLTNTKVIGSASGSEGATKGELLEIDQHLLDSYHQLADKLNISQKELIEIALQHFMNLEDFWFQKK